MKRTAAILLALLTMAGPVRALTVSKQAGDLIKEAQALIADKDYKGATAKLDEAEAVKAYPDDEIVINRFREFIASQTQQPPSPTQP